MARTDKQDGGKSWIFWGAGLLVVILVVVVGLLTIPTGDNEAEEPDEGLVAEGPDPSSDPVEPEEEPAETEAGDVSQCEDTDADSGFPTEAPEFVWEDYDGVEDFALPVSDEHGPAVQEDGFWRCFSQTPTGAALAAPHLFLSFVAGGHYEAAVDSPGAEAAFPEDPELERERTNGLVRGFRIVDSSEEEATIESWVATPDGSVDLVQQFRLIWDDEAHDWRLDLAGGLPEYQELTNTSDHTEWR